MYKTKHKRSSKHEYDILADLEKIRSAFSDTAKDVKGKASEVFLQSVENVKEKSAGLHSGVSNFIIERPLKTLGIALLSGWLIGYITKSRK